MIEIGAEDGGVIAVCWGIEEIAGGLGAGFEDEDGGLCGRVREVVGEEAAGCARWKRKSKRSVTDLQEF